MLIILEGVDRTGKSTLAAALHQAIAHSELRHCDRPEQHPLVEYEGDLDDYVPSDGNTVIYDRHLWGERVWPKIYGRETQYTNEMHLHAELFLQSRGAVVVHCVSGEKAIISRLIAASDPHPPHDQVSIALTLFNKVQAASRLPILRYDFTDTSLEDAVNLIVDMADSYEMSVDNVPTSHWIGDPYPSLLLVGDRPGPSTPDGAAVPFRPYTGASGVYLMRALASVKRSYAITNVLDGNGDEVPLTKLWISLGWPRVAALGKLASEALEAVGVPHTAMPHPQFVRRFHYNMVDDYTTLIEDIAKGKEARWLT